MILTNLFRDQLDRYGEIDITMELLKKAMHMAPVTNMLRLVSESSVSRKKKMQERSVKVSSANAAEKSWITIFTITVSLGIMSVRTADLKDRSSILMLKM